jgi:hypothetical protein
MEIDLTKTVAFAQVSDPELMKVDFAEIDARQKVVREQRERWHQAEVALRDPKAGTPADEYQTLSKENYTITQEAKHSEVFLNTKHADVRHWEQKQQVLHDLIKAAKKANNLGELKYLNNQLAVARQEHKQASDEFFKAKKRNDLAVRALRKFDHERFAALRKQLYGD